MRALKRFIPLVVSIVVVVAVALVGLLQSARANATAQQIRRDDRVSEERDLASLTNQYVMFALKDAYDFVSVTPLSLKPGDLADTAHIMAYVKRSALLNYGGALVSLSGSPLNAYSAKPGLPPATDPGYAPLRADLLAGKPGISSVMTVSSVPVVALAVPVQKGGETAAIFIGYFRADDNPLETYNERLHYGKSGRALLIDSTGTLVAAGDRTRVGKKFDDAPVLRALAARHSGFIEYTSHGTRMIASFSEDGIGGWASITTQSAAEFFGAIRSGGLHVALALAGLLVVAAAALFLMNHKRQMALARAYEYKGQLLANTTHELKTPLTAIRGAAVTLGMRWRTMSAEQVDQFLGIIHRRCDGLSKLIERILLGARLEAGREVALYPVPTDVLGSLRAITSEFKDVSPKHPVLLAAPEDVWVNADPEALDQVLGLLLENAIKYSPEGGHVEVEASEQDGGVRFSVRDEGLGIDPEDQDRIFEKFYRADPQMVRGVGGTGLGLYICKELVSRMGGRIWVEPNGDKGSAFFFELQTAEVLAHGPIEPGRLHFKQ